MLDKPSIFVFKLTSEIVKELNYSVCVLWGDGGGLEPVILMAEIVIFSLCWKTGNCTIAIAHEAVLSRVHVESRTL